MTDEALIGLDWNMVDTGLTIANPAYGLYRVFGGKRPGGSDEGVAPSGTFVDPTTLDAYKAQQAKMAALDAQEADAEKRRLEALAALAAVSKAPSAHGAPIQVQVPSFSLYPTAPVVPDAGTAVGYGFGDFVLDLFTGGSRTFGKLAQGVNPLNDSPLDQKEGSQVRDITQLDAYRAAQARAQEMRQRGLAAQRARDQVLRQFSAVQTAPLQSYTPISVNVPSFSIGEDE